MLGCTGAILAAANLEPELCADAFAGNVQAQKDLLWAHKICQRLRRQGHQGGAGPPLRHLHRLPLDGRGSTRCVASGSERASAHTLVG